MEMITGDKILEDMANTYKDRNKTYGESFMSMGPVMAALFPNGITLKTKEDFVTFHLLDWMVGKLNRFVNTGMTHIDSIHDLAVYAAMIEMVLLRQMEKERGK
jgi:hypothetical protein